MSQSDSSYLQHFFKQESAGGILLVLASALAIVLANSPLLSVYNLLIDTPVVVQIGALKLAKPLLMWVNDGLMAVFFLMVGLELKREFMEGELAELNKIILPGLGAIGGMVVPAFIYLALNRGDAIATQGWAIPTATDIAFALGVLSLLGPRVPIALKVFLTSLAIFDDIGAILIIAFFYTSKISLLALVVAGTCVLILAIMNRRNVSEKSPYLLIGLVMWVALVKSGVHATLAGVVLAMFIPMRSPVQGNESPAKSLEHDLHAAVAFVILPVFAFCNSGISFSGVGVDHLLHGVPLGIALGLFVGKQIGVFGFCWLGVKLKLTTLPDEISWLSLYGTALLCGIGFTMSLFVGSLAFEESGVNQLFDERLGIIIGSLLSGLLGFVVLNKSLKKTPKRPL
ncbi:MAG: Na+/H+ antiporter NhaA [Zhongshania sp.]|uniref:Na+/H+ antiporter NhaA n=1 Tax=Zhongshania sp. TaxID=1971902 RepID=UPI00260312A3|nr:Na+/H+ antiporter NhaA [Zhongshania sp.]MDF1691895.1 Na+/H+ antiporter NhaA [Zhongshania sp.]